MVVEQEEIPAINEIAHVAMIRVGNFIYPLKQYCEHHANL